MLQQETQKRRFMKYSLLLNPPSVCWILFRMYTHQIFKISKQILPGPHMRPSAPGPHKILTFLNWILYTTWRRIAHHRLHNTEKSLKITITNENIPTPPKIFFPSPRWRNLQSCYLKGKSLEQRGFGSCQR